MPLFRKKYRAFIRLGMRQNFHIDSDVQGYPVEITNLLFNFLQIAPVEAGAPEVMAAALVNHCELRKLDLMEIIEFARARSKMVTDANAVFNKPKL